MTPLLRKFFGINWLLFAVMICLIIFGCSAIYSASAQRDPEFAGKWRDQVVFAVLGLLPFFVASLIDYKWVKWLGVPLYILGIGLLVYTQFFGDEVYGTKGWIDLGFVTIQSSQVAIASGIIIMALILANMHKLHPIFRNPFMRLVVTGLAGMIPCAFVLKQGDFGSAMVWIPVIAAMVLVGNIPFRYLIVIVLCGTMVLPYAFFFGLKEYQKKRITVQLDMLMGKDVNVLNEAYSAYNNLLAIGSGGWEGKGFANKDTVNNKGFISNETAINDFIFPVLAEEHGFRGALMMMGGFLVMLLLCLFVAFYSRDMLGRLIAVGVLTLLLAHIFQNIGMNLLLMPITGIPLPLISYGGTFVIIVMSMLGLVQSVWVHRVDVEEEVKRPGQLEVEHLD